MIEPEREEPIRRILVALDASPPSLAALRAAAELAYSLRAELVGLYIEDINLLRMTEMPIARELSLFQPSPHPITRQQVEQQLRTQARLARRAMEAAAELHRIRWTFKVIQGVIPVELLAAAQDTDLIILGKAGWSHRRRLGSTARVIIQESDRQAIILGQGAHLGLPLGLLYNGSEEAKKTLHSAVHILRQRTGYLVAVILARTPEDARRLQAEASTQLRATGLHIHYRWLVNMEVGLLQAIVQTERLGLMLIPGESDLIRNPALQELLDRTACPIWIVR